MTYSVGVQRNTPTPIPEPPGADARTAPRELTPRSIALGIALALILDATVLSGTGFVLVIPATTMVVLFILAGIAGLAAAAWPARRAAHVDILAALATQ